VAIENRPLLVVDDDESNRDLLSRRLQRAGYLVDTAVDAPEALRKIGDTQYSLVLLDSMMPGVSGPDLLRQLRTTYSSDQLPVVMVTAVTESNKVAEAIESGANDYVTKPIDFRIALARIRSQLERRASSDALHRLALATSGANDGLWDWDVAANRVHYSPRWNAMLGLPEEEIDGRIEAWTGRVPEPDRTLLSAALEEHWTEGGDSTFEFEHRILHQDGDYRWVLCRAACVRDAAGRVIRMAGTITDVTGKKEWDPVTLLPNRMKVHEWLQRRLTAGLGESRPFSVLFADVDDFKLFNDSLGHAAGDALLREIAGRLRSVAAAEPGVLVARLGADEFAVLVDDSEENCARLAARVLGAMREPFHEGGQELYCTASIGISGRRSNYTTPGEILRDAGIAMQSARTHGKGRWTIFEPAMRESVVARLAIENGLRDALRNGRLELHYQPIVHVDSGDPYGFEALVRWRDPERGLIPPADFIPAAEANGLIVQIGKWVLRTACLQIREWNRGRPENPLKMCVNVSPLQLFDSGFREVVNEILTETQVPGAWLALELTESILVQGLPVASEQLQGLRDCGVGLKMDDFGTGYSSLSYLCQLPFDTLKIDRSFVSALAAGSASEEVVNAIISLAHMLHMKVVAEGIESPEQARILKQLGTDLGQGYFYSRALPAEAASDFLYGDVPSSFDRLPIRG
jgi:diguanylate cyclase (GGDEF)-like protein/PAS domain S-box-containing protein